MGNTIASLLAVDVGGGTQDILLWQAQQELENSVKLVLPSPTQVVAARLHQLRKEKRPVFLHGWLMGGGAITTAVKEHLNEGLAVYASPSAALSLADDLARVRSLGVQITEQAPDDAGCLLTTDLDLNAIKLMLSAFALDLPGQLAVAVCDHGYSPGESNRLFRFRMWEDFLAAGGFLSDLLWGQPPSHLTRMQAILEQAPGTLLMDTAAAALWGALEDSQAAAWQEQGLCLVNIGNMHTVAFLLQGQQVWAVFEHHTSCLSTAELGQQIERFRHHQLDQDEVFANWGHGCIYRDGLPESDWPIILTGPRRVLAKGLDWPVANPHGDVMLAGCFGLTAAVLARQGEKLQKNAD